MKLPDTKQKLFIDEEGLIEDSYRLAVQVLESGFRPNFIVGIWRGGSTVGIYVQECLQYLGVKTDHIAIRTSYRGMDDYMEKFGRPEEIRVHGLQYLLENLNSDDRLLLVDDVFSTGHSIEAVIERLQSKAKRNMPADIRVATVYYKPAHRRVNRQPDFHVHATERWLVFPYELMGLTRAEIAANKSWVQPMLPGTRGDHESTGGAGTPSPPAA